MSETQARARRFAPRAEPARRRAHARLAAVFALLLAAPLLAACAGGPEQPAPLDFERPESAITYAVELEGVEDERVRELMEQSLEVYRRQADGAQSRAFLRRRARADVETAKKILRAYGYYEAEVAVEIVDPPPDAAPAAPPPPPADDRPDPEAGGAAGEGAEPAAPPDAIARLTVTENRRYTLAAHRFQLIETGDGPPPAAPDAAALGSPVGKAARASRIIAAEQAAVAALRTDGRPYARALGREAVADPETAELEVETIISTGPAYVYGDVVYQGLDDVKADYLDTYVAFEKGGAANADELTELQRDLIATNLFDAGAVTFPEEPPEGPEVPVLVTVEEGPPRTVSAGVRYDTDAGPAVRGRFEHRNLFGANETITLDALLGLNEQDLQARYRTPQYLRPGQDRVVVLDLRHIDDDAFEEFGGTFIYGVEREISDEILVGLGGLLEVSEVKDNDGRETSTLVGLPVFAAYDDTDDKLDPSKGLRGRVALTPLTGYSGGNPVGFMVADANLSTYFDLTGEKRYILAARGRVASIIAGDIDVVSANRRLYSGGGGSVRGYRERFIGPLDDEDDPVGGLSAVELGAELRARVSNTVGVAGFVEAGSVSTDVAPDFDDGVQVAAGGGIRYFSPIGPLRVDVGVPVNPRDADDSFQIYIAIGQAF